MNKIFRSVEDPVHNQVAKKPYKILAAAHNDEKIEIRYKRGRWEALLYDSTHIKRRTTRAWIFSDNNHVGSILTHEYRVEAFTFADDFLLEMDDHSMETYSLASTLCASWENPDEIWVYGDIVDLNRIWIAPAFSNSGRMKFALNMFINSVFPDFSLLLLKAFPLEYESKVSEDNEVAFQRRKHAMMRYYRRNLGVKALSGENGSVGWMFSIPSRLDGIVPNPLTPPPSPANGAPS